MASVLDVAKRANVSIATASRVLSGSDYPVSRATRARVLKAAAILDYSPNALARAMATGRTGIVGVIVGDASDPYFAAIVRGVEDVARHHGQLVVVCNSDRNPAIELRYLRALNDYRVDGLIFAGGGLTDDAYLREVRGAIEVFGARGAACVALAPHLFPSYRVLIDNEQIVRDAVQYLHTQGHRRIAFVSGPPLLTTTGLRLAGYRAASAELGLAEEPGYVLEGDYSFEGGLRAATAVHGLRPTPTSLLASNDMMAIGAIVGLRQLGYRIPEDMSVMGIDDIPTAVAVQPALTTVAIPLHELGATGMESLLRLRAGELSADEGVTLPHRIIVRDSVMALRRQTS
jgi:LacI family transcriptional regulator